MQEITKIVVPVDLEQHTQKVADFAIYMAKKMGAQLRFIHVTEFYASGDMMLGSPSLETINQERVQRAKEVMNNLLDDNRAKYENISGIVYKGEIVDTIVKYAQEEQAGLIIIGTHGAKGLEKILLGSVAERVLKRAHCPTLTMNPYK
ncbi:universal stress protein [Desulfosediminicola flagellatus]|uniref:universal stress protein n=1 Tax=Desulfosediminicola flagellatus TaxID=2569541 RepID=UPI0010AC09CE|nr:universal stress protein [Desulfosediminicola flagellatus]